MTRTLNATLSALGFAPVPSIGACIAKAKESLLLTTPDFDHYENREDAEYFSIWGGSSDEFQGWKSSGPHKRIFAYLKPFPSLYALVRLLENWNCEVVLYGDGLPANVCQKLCEGSVRILQGPVDLQQVAKGCDLAITNGNHGTTLKFLEFGVPVFACPLHGEQSVTAATLKTLDIGSFFHVSKIEHAAFELGALLVDPEVKERVAEYATRVAESIGCGRQRAIEAILRIVDAI
ncbi:hypothetical protein U8335_19130 [Roseiconus lacunae]|uniref:glycosyltransferase n=1 Tax=Roseiconus lacunae TaxID=2605694 RepID=UPI00309198AD|nr:hypothetical protein U8335_19130 [Stieleria sp. HD01]